MASPQTPYDAAVQGAAYYILPSAGYLRIGDQDRSAFLQRQTTNDLRLAQPSRAVLTVLTTPTARILDVLYVLSGEDALDVITLPGRGASTARYLKTRIFFMDKVALADASAELAQIDLLGPQAPSVLAGLGIDPALQPDQVASGANAGLPLRALALEPTFGLGIRLLASIEAVPALQAYLNQAGAVQLQDDEYNLLHLEAGLPAVGAELSEDYTPLEAGLQAAISSTKGCYTGQEVVARQLTYDKVTQHLCGLRLARAGQVGERLWAADGSPVGRLTSVGSSPRFGQIALAMVKRPHHQPGTILKVGQAPDAGDEGQVAALPFAAV